MFCCSNRQIRKKSLKKILMPLGDERLNPIAGDRILAYPKYLPNPD